MNQENSTATVTPMMAQWQECKKNAKGALLLFRLGDFYEAFHEDADLLARELDLMLTKRQEIPMAGIPFHASEGYVDKLIAKGYRVAIAEQVEDPKTAKGLVRREIVRILTPGTIVNSSLLSDKTNNFLASFFQLNSLFGLALLDLTTAELRVFELENERTLLDELCRLQPKEILMTEKQSALIEELKQNFKPAVHSKEAWFFDQRSTLDYLLNHFQVHTLDGFGLKGMPAATAAAGALLNYVHEELNLPIDHIRTIQLERPTAYLSIDRTTERNLELLEPLQEGRKNSTLLHLLDQTATPMGARALRRWLSHPLIDIALIRKRQDAIEALYDFPTMVHLSRIRDLERLIMRIETGFASPRDLFSLRFSLEQIPSIASLLQTVSSSLISEELKKLHDVSSIVEKIKVALVDDPPLKLNEGGIFRTGYHPQLDELHALKSKSREWIANYQTQLKEATQIKTLKIGFTRAFGYYIEVSRGAAEKIPSHFERRQTLVNAERFTTRELKEYEHKVLSAEERAIALENELFAELRREISTYAAQIRDIAAAIAQIDCLLSLAQVAKQHNYVKPLLDESDTFFIQQGRHPVIEVNLPQQRFIPNDVALGMEHARLILLTGPNMAGKSTYIRQAALIAILAHMGSFVPAKSAHIGLLDKVFSRIGASDDLSRGQSTFMVEMAETASILNSATQRSLVILDEIGRGTSTYDGISIAWAVAEYLLTTAGKEAKTLFATHYWELSALEKQFPKVANFRVAIHEGEGRIVFLHKIVAGAADKSYGIHVARLAGLPQKAIKRAEEMLIELEKKHRPTLSKKEEQQLTLFVAPAKDTLKEKLDPLDPNQMTPLEALQKIIEWKNGL